LFVLPGRPDADDARARLSLSFFVSSDVPESGGHTNFRNAGVHVKPNTGNAVFFSYIDPETRIMDNGFTEHSGCPVYHGEKKIVTQWIRLGVDNDNPWDSFNTCTFCVFVCFVCCWLVGLFYFGYLCEVLTFYSPRAFVIVLDMNLNNKQQWGLK
jgi:hypothetical protein